MGRVWRRGDESLRLSLLLESIPCHLVVLFVCLLVCLSGHEGVGAFEERLSKHGVHTRSLCIR